MRTDNQAHTAEPAWEIAEIFPAQGHWGEADYLALETNRLVEFSHGHVEVLPMPTLRHQYIVLYLYRLLHAFVTAHGLGTVVVAPVRVQLWPGKYREPDLVLMRAEHSQRRHPDRWEGADLVVEVVSDSPRDRERDLVDKRREYAQAGIPEYWIVDPETERITVLRLETDEYGEHGVYRRGETATSATLAGFAVPVDDLLDADQ